MAENDQEGQRITLHVGFCDVYLNKYMLEAASLGLKTKSGKSLQEVVDPREIEVKPSKICTFFMMYCNNCNPVHNNFYVHVGS